MGAKSWIKVSAIIRGRWRTMRVPAPDRQAAATTAMAAWSSEVPTDSRFGAEEEGCKRCDSPFETVRRGAREVDLCSDETCPFSEHIQICSAGWNGHPERQGGSCNCPWRTK